MEASPRGGGCALPFDVRMKEKPIPPVWATAYDEFGDPSEDFTASREGLLYLSKRIDEALSKGEAPIGTDARFDFERIVVSDTHPSCTLKPRPILDKVMGALGIILIVAVIVLAVYGGHALYADWAHITK
jgi:hypothetical protein